MLRRSAVVVVPNRVYVASPRHTQLSAVCGSFNCRRLPPPGVAPFILLLLRAMSGGPGLLVPRVHSKTQAPRNTTFIKENRMRHELTHTDGRALNKHETPPHPKRTPLKKHFFLFFEIPWTCQLKG